MLIRQNILPKSIKDACVTAFVFAIIPLIYYFELFVVLPKYYKQWSPSYMFHFCTGNFILFNLCSNLMAIILCDTSIRGRVLPTDLRPDWRFCSVCGDNFPAKVLALRHLQHLMLRSVVTHERNTTSKYDRGPWENVKIVLGDKWYLVWLSPWIESRLPCDGIDWSSMVSDKVK
ncbi:hypothetical protein NQ318_006622 [Aromia moschata]|uniref:Uncharacterized protein n=1 Tax=Aromia moschata TaxID=1265417 RepID=A0AAV8XI55_9CUCU|nr:hypothetical protein NQ318_006622 [Aromia moschata]